MGEIIKLLKDQGLLFPLQIIILIIDAYLIIKGNPNGYISLSLVLIISTFVLQTLRRRFLLLYPRNGFINRETSEIDTYYLRGITILSSCFSLIGYLPNPSDIITKGGVFIESYLPLITLITIVIIPFLFWRFSEKINERVAKKLIKYGPNIFLTPCPCCEYPYAIRKNEVVNKNFGKVTFECEHCKNDVVREITLNIGE